MISAHEARPLRGVRVVDFGDYIAGPLTGMLLADQGADVVKVVRPGGAAYQAPASSVFNRGKRCLTLDLKNPGDRLRAEQLIGAADVVIENFRPLTMQRLGLGSKQMTHRNPGLIYVSLPGFSAADPRADLRAFEGIVGAAIGQFTNIHVIRQIMGASPLYSAIPMGSTYGAVHAATAIVMALIARERFGGGDIIEVPLADAAMSAMSGIVSHFQHQPRRYEIPPLPDTVRDVVLPNLRRLVRRLGPSIEKPIQTALSAAYPPVLDSYKTADRRWVMVVAAEHDRLTGRLLDALGIRQQLLAHGMVERNPYEVGTVSDNINDSALWSPRFRFIVRRLMRMKFLSAPASHWDARLTEFGVPFTIHRTTQEWLQSSPAQRSGLVVAVDEPKHGRLLQLGAQVCVSPANADDYRFEGARRVDDVDGLIAEWQARPVIPAAPKPDHAALHGIRVLDLSAVLAGPACARTLGEYGADVIKIDPVAPHAGPRVLCWFGAEVGQGKRNIQIDLAKDDGRAVLFRLAKTADVVISNFRPGVSERLGITPEQLRQHNPQLVHCHVTAFQGPRPGAWSDRAGYDPLLQAATGIMRRYGGEGRPELHGLASCVDYITGFSAAFGAGLALLQRLRTGQAGEVRTSLAQGAQLVQAPFMCSAQQPAVSTSSVPARLGEHALYRLYRARDGWIFLAGLPSERHKLRGVEFLAPLVSARQLSESRLHAILDPVIRQLDSQYATASFRRAGLGCHTVDSLETLRERAHVSVRSGHCAQFRPNGASILIAHIDHPAGTDYDFVPPLYARLDRRPIRLLEPAPKVGAHTREILAELGYSSARIQQLLGAQVVSEQLHAAYLPD